MKKHIFIIVFLSCIIFSSAQIKTNKEYLNLLYNAEYLIEKGNFKEAISLYENLLKDDPDNANINFKIGYCYLQLPPYEKVKAIKHLEKAKKNINYFSDGGNIVSKEAPIETYYYLSYAYHLNYEPQKALAYLDTFETLIKKYNIEINENIQTLRENCLHIQKILENANKVEIINIGNNVNSKYDEHSPVVSADQKVLLFTSNRPNEKGKIKYEKVYLCERDKNNNWSKPTILEWKNFKKKNIATIGLSADGTELFLYVDDSNILKPKNGNIYVSRYINNTWTMPEPLPINTKYNENHVSISYDGKELYFTSNRPGGYGKLDIYISRKDEKGRWGQPINLGPIINTPEDEAGPFIYYDNKTLYFSSKAHNSIGGYDIFFSTRDSTGNWSTPVNLGYPFNTPGDDIFINFAPDGKSGYYSTDHPDGVGGSDIYYFKLPDKTEKNVAVISGTITLKDYTIPSNVKISVYDYYSHELVSQYTPYPKSGKYLLLLETGKKYFIVYEGNEFIPQTEIIDLTSSVGYVNIDKYTFLETQAETYETDLKEITLNENKLNTYDSLVVFKNENKSIEIEKSISLSSIETINTQNNFYIKFKSNSIELTQDEYRKLMYACNLINKDTVKNVQIVTEDVNNNVYNEIRCNIIKDIIYQKTAKNVLCTKNTIDTLNNNYINIIITKADDVINKYEYNYSLLAKTKESVRFSKRDTFIEKIIYPVYFDFNRYTAEFNLTNLLNIVEIMEKNKDAILELTGHTDSIGTYKYNKMLSLKRAKFVKDQLVKLGINSKRIKINGVAFEQPVSDNSTFEGRKLNRRVSIKIYNCKDYNFKILEKITY
ncbi:MAG: OmpA family protein [Bacteroidales bacterium]|nr:OmpA family protein [Bacteroidales bacterium]